MYKDQLKIKINYKKRNKMVPLFQKIILRYLPTAVGSVLLCPKLMTVRAKERHHLLKETEQLKHSSNAAANKVTIKYKKQCQTNHKAGN